MKGVSIKKLAALGIGSLMALSLGFGAVSYEGTQLVNDNGVPQAKVVVGEKAGAIDGVAAAKIATFLASKAYKSSTFSAKVSGTATCAAGGSTGGVGTCPVTKKSVTLEVQLPGQSGGTYAFTTLIDDYIDRKTENRVRSLSGDDKYDSSASELGSNNRFDYPFYTTFSDPTAFASIGSVSTIKEAMVRVTGNDLTALKSSTVVDEKSAKKWEQRQYLWLAGYNKFDNIDDNNKIKVNPEIFAYSTKFFGVSGVSADGGIPQCTNDNAVDGDMTSCGTTGDSYYIGNHRVKIKFLGDDWIITDMNAPSYSASANLSQDGKFTTGGKVTLAKESKYGILNVGGAPLEAEGVKVRLGDIALATTANNVHRAILDILDSSDQIIQQTQVAPGESTEVLTPTGTKVKIRVYQTAPGFTLTQKWAELAVIKDEKILTHGQQIDGTDNKDYYVYLKWVNNLRPSSFTTQDDAYAPDALREVTVYRTNFDSGTYSEGSVVPMVVNPANFKFSYVGLDLDKSKDYDDLTFKIETGKTMSGVATMNAGGAAVTSCDTTATYDSVNVLSVRSSGGALKLDTYSGTSTSTPNTMESMYFTLNTPSGVAEQMFDVIFPLANQITCTDAKTASFGSYNSSWATTDAGKYYGIKYDLAGTQTSLTGGGYIKIAAGATVFNVTVIEDSGKWNTNVNVPANLTFYGDMDDSNPKLYQEYALTNKLDNNMYYYYNYRATSGTAYESLSYSKLLKVNQYTQRGSYLTYTGDTEARMRIAKTWGKLRFEMAAAGTAAGVTNDETLVEGDEREWAGVKVKVKQITCETGACTVGASGAPGGCTVDSTGVKAMIVDADGVEYPTGIEATVPVALSSDLLVLDSTAPSGLVVSVGGPYVNTVTKGALGDSVDFTKQNVVVKKNGNVIVVAGLSGADTLTAARQFVDALKSE